MNLKTIALSVSFLAGISTASANSVSIYDDTFSLFNGAAQVTSGTYNVLWGTFSAGVFTPLLGAAPSDDNSAYIDVVSPELSATFTQTNNANISVGAQFALAITLQADNTNYVSSADEVILTDSNWLAPTFVFLSDPIISFTLSESTTALKGSYSFNGDNQILTIGSVIPEPSTYAALAGVAVLGLAALRRRRA